MQQKGSYTSAHWPLQLFSGIVQRFSVYPTGNALLCTQGSHRSLNFSFIFQACKVLENYRSVPWKSLNFIFEVLESPWDFDQRDSNKERLKTLLLVLIDKQRFHEKYADDIEEYTKYIDEVVAELWIGFLSFMSGDRISTLFHDTVASCKHFS